MGENKEQVLQTLLDAANAELRDKDDENANLASRLAEALEAVKAEVRKVAGAVGEFEIDMIHRRLCQILNPAPGVLSAQWHAAYALFYLTGDEAFVARTNAIAAQPLAASAVPAWQERVASDPKDYTERTAMLDENAALRAAAPRQEAQLAAHAQFIAEPKGLSADVLATMYTAFQRGDSVERVHAAVMALVEAAPTLPQQDAVQAPAPELPAPWVKAGEPMDCVAQRDYFTGSDMEAYADACVLAASPLPAAQGAVTRNEVFAYVNKLVSDDLREALKPDAPAQQPAASSTEAK